MARCKRRSWRQHPRTPDHLLCCHAYTHLLALPSTCLRCAWKTASSQTAVYDCLLGAQGPRAKYWCARRGGRDRPWRAARATAAALDQNGLGQPARTGTQHACRPLQGQVHRQWKPAGPTSTRAQHSRLHCLRATSSCKLIDSLCLTSWGCVPVQATRLGPATPGLAAPAVRGHISPARMTGTPPAERPDTPSAHQVPSLLLSIKPACAGIRLECMDLLHPKTRIWSSLRLLGSLGTMLTGV